MSQSTAQGEHLKDMLVGNILAVSWDEVWQDRRALRAIGVFHFIFRKRFLLISMDPRSRRGGRHLAAVLGFPVLRLVRIRRHVVGVDRRRAAGVLLPDRAVGGGDAVCGRASAPRLAIGWSMGTVVSVLGMYFSVVFDLPTGATIVCTFGAVLIAMAAVKPLLVRKAA